MVGLGMCTKPQSGAPQCSFKLGTQAVAPGPAAAQAQLS
jgi:hypothetical protein